MKAVGVVVSVLVALSSAAFAVVDYRVKTGELGAPLIVFPSKNLTISEHCGLDDRIQRKVLYPTELTATHNIVLTAAPTYSPLPLLIQGGSVPANPYTGEIVSVSKNQVSNTVSIRTNVGDVTMGTIVTEDANTITFSPTLESFQYDLGSKVFVMNPLCQYKIRNEVVYPVRFDNTDFLISEMNGRLDFERLTATQLSEKLTFVLDEIGNINAILVDLRNSISSANLDYAALLGTRAQLELDISELESRVASMDLSLEDIDAIQAEIRDYEVQIENLNTKILQLEGEIEDLLGDYNAKKLELESKSPILRGILDSVNSECELREVIANVIVPATREKQSYSIDHLKGDIVPTKIIHVDE